MLRVRFFSPGLQSQPQSAAGLWSRMMSPRPLCGPKGCTEGNGDTTGLVRPLAFTDEEMDWKRSDLLHLVGGRTGTRTGLLPGLFHFLGTLLGSWDALGFV